MLITGILISLLSVLLSSATETPAPAERLRVSKRNPHLLETVSGKPVFLNNDTDWGWVLMGKRKDIAEVVTLRRSQRFNMFSVSILGEDSWNTKRGFISAYDDAAFELDQNGQPDPLKPVTTPGNNPAIPDEYDFWDHVDYIAETVLASGSYLSLHPAWGFWISGLYSGKPVPQIVFNENNAYQYGNWLGKRYCKYPNLIWMLGGDRSAIYDEKTRNAFIPPSGKLDFRKIWIAMAEGLADGSNNINSHDGNADYSNILISYHPRKWAPNSSEWFHDCEWLKFNSIQDTPYDQIGSVPHDYNLLPVKPTWLFEGRYEGATSAWAVRYQAYQTVLSGGFGHTYGSDARDLGENWRELAGMPGATQMEYLYTVARDIWSDNEFFDRIPDQDLIIGDQGRTVGDGMTTGDTEEGNKIATDTVTSDRITAMRAGNGRWAMIYTANGRDIEVDLSRLSNNKMNIYWFNPRNGMWLAKDLEMKIMSPYLKGFRTGKGTYRFDPPGEPAPGNDWILIIRK